MATKTASATKAPTKQTKRQPMWLIYGALILAGLLFVAEAINYYPLQRVPARLAIGLLYSALALIVGNGRKIGMVAAAIICIAVIAVFFV